MGAKGILGEKLGMSQVFSDDGRALPVTVIKAGPCRVVQVKTPETDGYSAVQLSYGSDRRATKPVAGHYVKAGTEPGRHLVELRTDEAFEAGQELRADVFQPGDRADVVGVSKGKGFAGVMKRHGFGGLVMVRSSVKTEDRKESA
jgi:large subunit ribosomal protein L3